MENIHKEARFGKNEVTLSIDYDIASLSLEVTI